MKLTYRCSPSILLLLGLAQACVKISPPDMDEPDTSTPTPADTAADADTDTDADTDADADADTDTDTDTGPPDPIEIECSETPGSASASGMIEGSPARQTSAAWYANDEHQAWVVLSPAANACEQITAFLRNDHDSRAVSIWLTDWDPGDTGVVNVVQEPSLTLGDSTPEVVVNGWEPLLNISVQMDHGSLQVRHAEREGELQVTGLDSWSEFGDTMFGNFTACWCPAVENFNWPLVEDSSPPPPPPVSD